MTLCVAGSSENDSSVSLPLSAAATTTVAIIMIAVVGTLAYRRQQR